MCIRDRLTTGGSPAAGADPAAEGRRPHCALLQRGLPRHRRRRLRGSPSALPCRAGLLLPDHRRRRRAEPHRPGLTAAQDIHRKLPDTAYKLVRVTTSPPEAKLLVVEDEPSIRELLATSLRLAGFEVHVAADGATAIKQAATCTSNPAKRR